jgi:hypothetical protein
MLAGRLAASRQAMAGTISFFSLSSSGRMSNEIVAASSTPPRLSKCTRYTSANNSALHTRQKPKRKRHKKPIATEVYCNIVKRVSAVMQLFSVRLQFRFVLAEAVCFIFRKDRKMFMVSFSLAVVSHWVLAWARILHFFPSDSHRPLLTRTVTFLPAPSDRFPNGFTFVATPGEVAREANKPRLSNRCKIRTLETLTSAAFLNSKAKTEAPRESAKTLCSERSHKAERATREEKKKFHCFPDRKRNIISELCNVSAQNDAALGEEIFIFFFFTRNKTIKVIQKSRSCKSLPDSIS